MEAAVEEAIAFLNKAKAEVADLEQARNEFQSLNSSKIRLQKQLSSEEKAVSDEISATVRRRREEICASYDSEISKAQDKLKKHRQRKAQAKNEGKKERIEYETSELREENRQLKTEFLGLLKRHRMPGMCKSRWFYALFMPVGVLEHFLVILIAALLLLALPLFIYEKTGLEATFGLTIITALCMAVFGTPYILISERITFKNYDVLRRTSILRRKIEKNEKKIRLIALNIKKDDGEEYYELDDFNYDIAKAEAMVDEISHKKDEALEAFDTVTARVIEDEIREGSAKQIDVLKAELSEKISECAQADEIVREKNVRVTDRFAGMIGKDNLSVSSINSVIKILQNGDASTITEAVAIFRTNKI